MALTKKQQRFVELMAEGEERTPAARAAGYANPSRSAYRMMKKDHICDAIDAARAQRQQANQPPSNPHQAAVEGRLLELQERRQLLSRTAFTLDGRLKDAEPEDDITRLAYAAVAVIGELNKMDGVYSGRQETGDRIPQGDDLEAEILRLQNISEDA